MLQDIQAPAWFIAIISAVPTLAAALFAYLTSRSKLKHARKIDTIRLQHSERVSDLEIGIKFRDQLLSHLDQNDRKIQALENTVEDQRSRIQEMEKAEEECLKREEDLHVRLIKIEQQQERR